MTPCVTHDAEGVNGTMPKPKAKQITRQTKPATISLQVTDDTRNELEKVAIAEDRSVSHLVRKAIDKFLESRQSVA